MTSDDVRRIVAALPGATTDRSHRGDVRFRVGGHTFAFLDEDAATAMVKTTPDERAALVAGAPAVFADSHASGRFAWVTVRLAGADPDEFTELLTEAWRLSAGGKNL